MDVVTTAGEARRALAGVARPLGFVPTMGALHPGHLALVAEARRRDATIAASIFVNPMQFGPNDDFARYPRAFDADAAAFREAGVGILYAPDVADVYPPGFATVVDPGPLAVPFEGERRPGHFAGVATVVTKLLNVVRPERLYLGQKDVQQVLVLRRLVCDLDLATEVVVVPTVREPDGLARSSRNVYLTPEERAAAPSLAAALDTAARSLRAGDDVAALLAAGRAELRAPLVWEYLALVDPATLAPLAESRVPALLLAVARAGSTRLLDNLPIPDARGVDGVLVTGAAA